MNGTSRRKNAGLLLLAAFAMLFAGLGATCDALCCPLAAPSASMNATMPCCAGAASMSRGDAMRVEASTATARVQMPAPAAVIVSVTVRSAGVPRSSSEFLGVVQQESAPPLFLRNAQLLI